MVGGEHSQKFRSLALTVGETQCCEDIFTKDDNVMTFFPQNLLLLFRQNSLFLVQVLGLKGPKAKF